MHDLTEQIRKASTGGLYYIALFGALALPDICGALESDDGLANKQRYIQWFDAHVAPEYNGSLDGETCYCFRCSMLHQGSTQHRRSRYSRILFFEPGNSGFVVHNFILNDDALFIDVRIFCEDICAAVERWLPEASKKPSFQANVARFVRRHPQGLAPYIGGVPVFS